MNSITIITICYNQELYIASTIESVINQKNINLQYIIIDGASNDNTINIINKYRDYIDIIISEQDSGIYNAINKGISLAKNDIVGIVHSGDQLIPCSLSKVINFFNNKNCDIVYGDMYLKSLNNEIQIMLADHNLLGKKMSVFHPSTFIKKSVYDNNGLYNEKYRIASDYDYLLNLYLKKYNFSYLNSPLAVFQIGGISDNKVFLRLNENILIRNKYFGIYVAIKYAFEIYFKSIFFILRNKIGHLILGEKLYLKFKSLINRTE